MLCVKSDGNRDICFGRFRLDLKRRELFRDGRLLRLGGRPLDILCVLASADGSVVDKDELLERLWPGRAVEEGNLHVHVSALRRVLGEYGHSYVVTVPGRGYRLSGLSDSELARFEGSGNQSASLDKQISVSDEEANAGSIDKALAPQRRQLTVISCELVGATRLAALLDPEDFAAAIAGAHSHCTDIVTSFGGNVIQFAGGWGMLGYFGYPQADEHDAERAVRAALALARGIDDTDAQGERLQLRLAVATGPVIVGPVRDGSPESDGVLGEAVSIATALRRTAETGTVLIANSTKHLVGGLFDVRERKEVRLEGFEHPIEAWSVLRPSAVESRFRALHGSRLTPLVGREEELELLLRRWRRIKSGESRVVLITGEAGIGKSRLCVELQEHISQRERHTSIRYYCSPHHRDSALHPVIRQLEVASGFERRDTPETKLTKFKALLGSGTSVSEAEISPLAEILSLPAQSEFFHAATSRSRRDLIFEALIRQLEAISRRSPVLLIFEDAHWSDPTTLELLDLTLQKIVQRPVLVVITFRPEFAAPWTGQSGVTTLTLSRLDRRDSAELVQHAVGEGTLASDVVETILERTDGVPLFLEELSKTLAESDAVDAARPTIRIPATLHASLIARFDRLDSSTKEVAQAGAAIGREFSYELIEGICPQIGGVLKAALERLLASGLAISRGQQPNAVFQFKHGLVQDAIYSTLGRSKRRQLHGDIAEVLEQLAPQTVEQQPEVLAHHLTVAERPDAAVKYWRLAIERALRTSAYREAISHASNGLQVVASMVDRHAQLRLEVSLQLQRGIALTASEGPSSPEMFEAFNSARKIAEELGDDRALASASLGLWAHHNARANLASALALAQRLNAIGEARNETALRVQAHAASLTVTYKMGRFEKAWEHFKRGTKLYRPGMQIIEAIPNYTSPGPDMLLHGSFVAWVLGYPERARRLAGETMAAAQKADQPYTFTHCVYMLGHLAELQDDWEAVRRANAETVELARRWGFAGTIQLVERRISLVSVILDRDEEQFRLKCEHRQPGFARTLHDVILARMCIFLGDYQKGLTLLQEALSVTEATGSCFYDAEVYRTRGGLLASLGRWSEAEASYFKAIEIANRQKARMWGLRAATELASQWGDRGERQRGLDLLAPVYAWFTEGHEIAEELRAARTVMSDLS